jgi:hypothetical protein
MNNNARSAKSASDNYRTLDNCSNSVMAACSIPNTVFNDDIKTLLKTCATIFNQSKLGSAGSSSVVPGVY